jgi:hypothetical protein
MVGYGANHTAGSINGQRSGGLLGELEILGQGAIAGQ